MYLKTLSSWLLFPPEAVSPWSCLTTEDRTHKQVRTNSHRQI